MAERGHLETIPDWASQMIYGTLLRDQRLRPHLQTAMDHSLLLAIRLSCSGQWTLQQYLDLFIFVYKQKMPVRAEIWQFTYCTPESCLTSDIWQPTQTHECSKLCLLSYFKLEQSWPKRDSCRHHCQSILMCWNTQDQQKQVLGRH